jgi:hypothetical protein
MATLLIGAVINIGVGLLLGAITRKAPPTQYVEGPRLSDLKVSSSSYGGFINIISGSMRCGGNMIWSPGIQEHKNVREETVSAKGGGKSQTTITTTYSYSCSMAFAFCEGEAADIIRIWADGKLIYDKTGGSASQGQYQFRFYPGSETQLPDPTIEAALGPTRTPAYRGLCYIVCKDWPLIDFGNRVPNIEAEVAMVANPSQPFTTFASIEGLPGDLQYFYVDPNSDSVYALGAAGVTEYSVGEEGERNAWVDPLSGPTIDEFGYNPVMLPDGNIWKQSFGGNGSPIYKYDPLTGDKLDKVWTSTRGIFTSDGGAIFPDAATGAWPTGGQIGGLLVSKNPEDGLIILFSPDSAAGLGDGGIYTATRDSKADPVFTGAAGNPWTFGGLIADTDIGDSGPMVSSPDGKFVVSVQQNATTLEVWLLTRAPVNVSGTTTVEGHDVTLVPSGVAASKLCSLVRGVDFPCANAVRYFCIVPLELSCIFSDGLTMFKLDMITGEVLETNSDMGFRAYNNYSTNGQFAFRSQTSNEAVTISTDDLTEIRRESLAANFPSGTGTMTAYDPRNHSILVDAGGSTMTQVLLNRGTGLGQNLDGIVADICRRAGLTDDQFDTSLLGTINVPGFALTNQSSARDDIEPLMHSFLFEGVESDWKIKFIPRGLTSAVTIPQSKIGKLRDNNAKDPVVKETITLETELPTSVYVSYADRDNDYQQGNQQSRRYTLPFPTQYALNTDMMDLPVASYATDMKKLSERVLYTLWAERVRIATQLPWEYIYLDPTDVFTITYQGEDRLVRMGSVEVGVDLMLDFSATQEDARSNDSAAVGSNGDGFQQQHVPSNLPTKLFLLDAPLLLDTDDGLQQFSRAYWAAAGYDPSWRGTTLVVSRDEGSSFATLGVTTTPATWGRVVGTVPDPSARGTTATWNEDASFQIVVYSGLDAFMTASESDVLSGTNALAVLKRDGSMEIIQFQNVTGINDTTVEVSRLLRGRRGTEDNAYDHGAAEQVVLLRSTETLPLRIALADIGKTLEYKAPTILQSIEQTAARFHAYTGQDLMPYSVVDIQGSRDGSGNLTLTWKRRTRYNGALVDGTDAVPLNEQEELYDVDLVVNDEVVFSKEDVTAQTVVITAAEWAAAGLTPGDCFLTNGDFETDAVGVTATGWTLTSDGTGVATQVVATSPHGGTKCLRFDNGIMSTGVATSDLMDLFDRGWNQADIDHQQPALTLTWWQERTAADADTVTAQVKFYRGDGTTLISTADNGAISPAVQNVWEQKTFSPTVPVGTRYVRVVFTGTRSTGGLDVASVGVDDVKVAIGVGVPRCIVYVYQKSTIVGRGRVTPVGL